jgi:hypothetical protein
MSNQFSMQRGDVGHRTASLTTTLSGLVLVLLGQACGARYEIGELEPPLVDVEPPLGDDPTGGGGLSAVLVLDGLEDADAELSDVYYDIFPLGDVDGDGFGDWMDFGQLVYGAPRPGAGLALSSEKGPHFTIGLSTVGAGDFNGDGYSDVIAHDRLDKRFDELPPEEPSPAAFEARKQREAEFFRTVPQSQAFLWYGGPERSYGEHVINDEAVGFRVTEDLTSAYRSLLAGLGDDVERTGKYDVWPDAIGDIDGDGYGDLAVRAYFVWSTRRGNPEFPYGVENLDSGGESMTYIYYGRRERFELGAQREPDARLADVNLTPIGDVNGDGYADMQAMTASGSYVIAGSAKRLPARPVLDAIAVPLLGEDPEAFETSALGDIDGDGFDDFSIGSYLFYGSPSLLQGPIHRSDSDAEIVASDLQQLRAAGDWNGDGKSDLLIRQVHNPVRDAYDYHEGLSVIAGTSQRFSGRYEVPPFEPKHAENAGVNGYKDFFSPGYAFGADLDGDGRADICFGGGDHTWHVKYGGPLTTTIR